MISMCVGMPRKNTDLIQLYQDSAHVSTRNQAYTGHYTALNKRRCPYTSEYASVHLMYMDLFYHRLIYISRSESALHLRLPSNTRTKFIIQRSPMKNACTAG